MAAVRDLLAESGTLDVRRAKAAFKAAKEESIAASLDSLAALYLAGVCGVGYGLRQIIEVQANAGASVEKIVINDVRIAGNQPSPGGVFSAAFPMFDGSNRLFVSWSLCRVLEGATIVPCTQDRLDDPDAVRAPPMYGIWIYDLASDTQQPVVPPQ